MTAHRPLLPVARRRLRPDARVVVGVALVAASILGGARVLLAADDTVPVVTAARDLPPNHRVAAGDLAVARVRVPADVLDGLVPAAERDALVGRVVVAPVAGGALLARRAVGSAPAAGREVTIPVEPEHALAGALRAGDRVDVLATFGAGTREARTLTVVADAEVVDVLRSGGLFGGGDDALRALTLSVAPDDAVYVAFAARNADLDVVRSTGAAAAARTRVDLGAVP